MIKIGRPPERAVMKMTELTKEQLIAFIEHRKQFARCGCRFSDLDNTLDAKVLYIAMASLEAKKVILYRERNPYNGMTTGWQELTEQEYEFVKDNASENAEFRTVYTAPPSPVVPDEYRHLSELYHSQEKCLFKLAQRIKGPAFDKYAHSPSQAIDVLEAAIFGVDEEACRAAMLQAVNSQVIPDKSVRD